MRERYSHLDLSEIEILIICSRHGRSEHRNAQEGVRYVYSYAKVS